MTFTFWNYYVLKLLRLETIMISDATFCRSIILCNVHTLVTGVQDLFSTLKEVAVRQLHVRYCTWRTKAKADRASKSPYRKVSIVYRVPESLCCRMIWSHPPLPFMLYDNTYIQWERQGGHFSREGGRGDPIHTAAQKLWYSIPVVGKLIMQIDNRWIDAHRITIWI